MQNKSQSPDTDDPQREPLPATRLSAFASIKSVAPGLAVCLVTGLLCIFASRFLSGFSALLLAILLGAIWRNLAPVPQALNPGIAIASKKLLRLGIVFLGLQLSLGTIIGLGPGVLLVVLLSVGVTFAATLWIGGKMGIELPQRLLIATGFSICGAAAVAGTEGVTRAKQDQVATAIGLVVLFGTLMIPAMPLLGALLGFDDRSTGMLIGASTHEVAQVVAAGGSVSAAALAVAVTVKLARVVLLAPIIAGLGLYMRRKHSVEGGKNPPLIPLFVLGFIVAMLLRTTGLLPESVLSMMQNLQTLLLAAAMFALGLGVHLRSIVKSGGKALVLGLCGTLVIIVVATAGTMLFPPA
ncbi:YeiH family protein [Glutamicibacter sp.]|uniref:YeiH family protein n=1 Tax=Glutamicibacter sp. TaxID=1931995 RepID=UPI002B4A3D21|nr:putative sulfate exporter family transporter [Glutamicibacter sp.]HJX78945.1 putative sulfate exporter family transporter [Glutamicibacter sp.]